MTRLQPGSRHLAVVAVGLVGVAAVAYSLRSQRVEPLVQSPSGDHGQMGAAAPAPGSADPFATGRDSRADVSLDLRRQQLIGVRTAVVEYAPASATIRAVGLVRADETRLTNVNLKLEGWIRELYVDYTGMLVQQGDPLFALYSPDLLATQQEYVLALETQDRLRDSQVADARDYADRLVVAARRRLALWDLPADQLQMLDDSREAQEVVTFRAPATGYVVEKAAIEGMHVMPGQTLFTLADLTRVWVEAEIFEQEVPLVVVGQHARVTLDAYPGERFTGEVIYVHPFVEERTRTVIARFELDNRRGRLKPGMFANVELEASIGQSLLVPANALLDSGTRQLVFVAQGDGYFQPRDVVAGRRLGEHVQILSGLQAGEQVAESATFFLDAESQLRSSIGSFQAPTEASAGADSAARLAITFRADPETPRPGNAAFEVTVRDPTGQPVSSAEVSVTLFMPAMPSMSMPAMRSAGRLPAVGDGVYRGLVEVLMAGRWDATVVVTRGGQRLGSGQFSVVAR